jgi:hypothetical protein
VRASRVIPPQRATGQLACSDGLASDDDFHAAMVSAATDSSEAVAEIDTRAVNQRRVVDTTAMVSIWT